MKIRLTEKFAQRVNAKFSRYEFQVGILKDSTHRRPRSKKDGFTSLAGGPSRKSSRVPSEVKVSEVSAFIRANGTDYLTEPFKKPASKDSALLKRFLFEFLKITRGNTSVRRLENLLQAVVRNPMARNDYGPNASSTERRKGFNRFTIDTGQLFRSIKAKVVKVARRSRV